MLGGYRNTGAQPANSGIRLLPRAGEQYRKAPAIWGDNQTWVYTGQFYVPAGVTTVAFAGNIDDGWYLTFNGAVYHDWAWGGHTGAISVTPNTWHDIDLRFANGGGGAGAAWWQQLGRQSARYGHVSQSALGQRLRLRPQPGQSQQRQRQRLPGAHRQRRDEPVPRLRRGPVQDRQRDGDPLGANTAAGPTTVSRARCW